MRQSSLHAVQKRRVAAWDWVSGGRTRPPQLASQLLPPVLARDREAAGPIGFINHRVARRMTTSLVVAALSGTAGTSLATGISVARFGGEHGTPMTTDATATFYNPAGIVGQTGGHLYGDLNLALRHLTYERAGSATDAAIPTGAEGANTGTASLVNLIAEPFFGVTYRFGDVALGASYYVPYGGQSSWSKNDAFAGNTRFPGAVDGVQRWYSIQGELRSSYATLAAAYDFGTVQAGISANLIDTIANTVRAKDPTGGNDVRDEGRSWLDARSLDFSLGAGVAWEPKSKLVRVGLSYQSRPHVTGGIRAGGHLHTLFASGSSNDNQIDFLTNLPDVFRGGVSYRPSPDVELRLFGDYQRWSAVANMCVVNPGTDCNIGANGSGSPNVILNQVRDWHDTFGVRGGASYWFTRAVEAFGGAGFTSNAIPDRTLEPALPDFHAITVAGGAGFLVGDRLHFNAGYTQVFYVSRDTSGQSIHPTLAAASKGPDSSGKYTQQIGLLNLNAEFRF
jgi:long-chain fatty acid transport protein